MLSFFARGVALLTVLIALSGDAFAAERAARSTGLQRLTNPFSVSIYSRLKADPFGFPTLTPTAITAPTTVVSSPAPAAAPVTSVAPVEELSSLEIAPASVVVRTPYRPPVRSPFRPPPRPPFIP
jgi:hypothetical protein